MKQFLKQYYKPTDIFYLLFLNRVDKKKTYQRYTGLNRKNFQQLIDESSIKNRNDYDLYFSLNTFRFNEKKIMRSKKHVKEVRAIYFDIDEDAINIKNKILNTEPFQSPTFIIQTSPKKYQLIYLLEESRTTNFNEFEQILQFLTQHFKTDKTFDISRIFRVPNLINNKNGFKVNYEYNDTAKIDYKNIIQFVFSHGFKYQKDIKKSTTFKSIREKRTTKSTHKPLKSFLYNVDQYKDTKSKKNTQYDYLLRKYDDDKSTADLAYCKWLVYKKGVKKDETIIKKLIEARGYEDLTTSHPYIDDYLSVILIKCRY